MNNHRRIHTHTYSYLHIYTFFGIFGHFFKVKPIHHAARSVCNPDANCKSPILGLSTDMAQEN